MIDTAKSYFYMTDLVFDRLQDHKALQRAGTKLYGNKFYLKHPFGLQNPSVRFDLDKGYFCIETSLTKLFQGHNVAGTNQLEFLCLKTANLIYQQLGLRFTPQERRLVQDRGIRLGRLDATCGFSMSSPQAVSDTLEAVWEQLRAEGFNWSAYGGAKFESVYSQQHSTRVSNKFYYKGGELLTKKIPAGIVAWNRVWEYARTLLRFEVTWRAKELKDLDLEYADQWTPQLVKEKISERLKMFKFQGVIKQRLDTLSLEGLNDSCSMYYVLWTQGANLRQHQYNKTLDRARKHLLQEHQIDIYRSAQSGSDIPLCDLLSPENAYFVAPKRLSRSGAIFGMAQSLR